MNFLNENILKPLEDTFLKPFLDPTEFDEGDEITSSIYLSDYLSNHQFQVFSKNDLEELQEFKGNQEKWLKEEVLGKGF